MAKRTDIHRPGAIVPSAYTYIDSYALPSGGEDPDPGYNHREVRAFCEATNQPVIGTLGKCGICGAAFRYGDVWEHSAGDLVHVGHDCADKYAMLARRPGFDAALAALKRARAARIEAEAGKVRLERFCVTVPGLAEAFEVDHYIIKDVAARLRQCGAISPKQVAMVLKIAREETERAKRPAEPSERHVTAPEGRVVVRGRVVSKKVVESIYGETLKMTVKVETPEGTWLAWGTCPGSIAYIQPKDGPAYCVERGDTVEFRATLTRGRDSHFALFKRPTNAAIVVRGEANP